jgi:uncharacterized membrane protein
MKHVRKVSIVSLASVLLAGAIIGATQEQSAGPAAAVSRYSGIAKVKATSLRVEIKDWHFVRTAQGVRLPVTGFYIAQLTSGRIDTEIAGKQEHHRAGDFWTVAAGQTMTVSFPPHSEAAHIKTIAITPAAGAR